MGFKQLMDSLEERDKMFGQTQEQKMFIEYQANLITVKEDDIDRARKQRAKETTVSKGFLQKELAKISKQLADQ